MVSMLLRAIPLVALLSAATASPNVAYFRHHNMDRSSQLDVSSDAKTVTLNEWNATINLFDTKTDVKVRRLDVTGDPGSTVSLYTHSVLALTEGPLYFFHNSSNLTVTVSGGKSYAMAKTDAVVWIARGACISLSVTLSDDGEASIMAVTSGEVKWAGTATNTRASCNATAAVLVGAGTQMGGGGSSGGPGFFYNEVAYTLANSSSCTNPLTHGENGYSQTDEPIGPLDAHFHTRGALYYTQYGSSKYNDEAAPNDTIYTGELRFVNSGVYYGPEEMDSSTCYVASVHEADPAAVNPIGEAPSSECPFACMNKLDGKTAARCVKASTSNA